MSTIKTSQRYPLPETLEPPLAALHAYWDGLKRGWKVMPYWDDLRLDQLGDTRAHIVLFDVMDRPHRFRFAETGKEVVEATGDDLLGRFADEVTDKGALASLAEQCRATVAESAPTYARSDGYARLLLPLWGNGEISMLIGAIAMATG